MLGHKGPLYALAQGPVPQLFYSGGSDGMVVLWDLTTPDNGTLIAAVPGVIYCIQPLGTQYLLVGTDKGGIHVIDLNTNTEIKYLLNHTNGLYAIQVLPTKGLFIALGGDGAFSVWNSHTFTCLSTYKLCEGKLRSADATADESILAIACGDNTIRLFDTTNFTLLHELGGHKLSVNVVKYSPDGRYLLSGSRDAHLHIYDATTLELLKAIPAHNYAIYSIVYSPDAQLLATASRDKTFKIWDAETFDILARIDKAGHDAHVNSVNKLLWTSHHNQLISTGDDRAVLAWQLS